MNSIQKIIITYIIGSLIGIIISTLNVEMVVQIHNYLKNDNLIVLHNLEIKGK